jgi:hypothetical protein
VTFRWCFDTPESTCDRARLYVTAPSSVQPEYVLSIGRTVSFRFGSSGMAAANPCPVAAQMDVTYPTRGSRRDTVLSKLTWGVCCDPDDARGPGASLGVRIELLVGLLGEILSDFRASPKSTVVMKSVLAFSGSLNVEALVPRGCLQPVPLCSFFSDGLSCFVFPNRLNELRGGATAHPFSTLTPASWVQPWSIDLRVSELAMCLSALFRYHGEVSGSSEWVGGRVGMAENLVYLK